MAEQHGTKDLLLLFADTQMEDEDLYRFLHEAAANIGGELVKIADGRDPWQVFINCRFLGNSRVDPCSRILKRELLRRWLEQNCKPESTTVYLGIDWTEIHRFERAKRYWHPWKVAVPLCEKPYLSKPDMFQLLERAGIEPPRLYKMGFPHNNCGGFCVKAGQAQFRLLLEKMPERYHYHEAREQELRRHLRKNVAILKDRSGGKTTPLTLREFRGRVKAGLNTGNDWGGCGCFL
ncbi:MAG: hypothetical protein HY645_13490 [Acidobacteria bacterium]|nr:hypothetical protein [Acidobacteriota bacterium]